MPKGSDVDKCYQKVKKQGHSAGSAARICQAATGESLQTGKKAKKHSKSLLPPRVKPSKILRGRRSCLD